MTNPSPLAKVPANVQQANTSLSLVVRNVDDLRALARIFAASGMFGPANQDQTLAKCAIQLMAGMEAGFTPFASITGIYVVNGKPGFSAQLLAQSIKRHPRYDYRVREKTAEKCTIAFMEDGQEIGIETFTTDMARRAGLTGGPWKSYPEAMLFARALTAGMRTHCPDALGGHTPYTPEELGAKGQISEDGMVVVEDVTPAAAPVPVDRDGIQRQVLRRLTDLGVTPAGITALVHRAGGPDCRAIGQLPDQALQKLLTGVITPEKVAEWNGSEADPEDEMGPEGEDEDAPLLWQGAAT
jgi:hypothetical protein